MAKRNSRRRNSRKSNFPEERTTRGGNHDAWYQNLPTLTKNVGTLPFVWGVGPNYGSSYSDIVPSIMVLNTLLTPGILKSGVDPLNVADRYAWNNQRATNAGYNYTDPQDVGQIWFSIINAHAFYYWAKRIYGTLRMFNPMNRFFPRYALDAAWIDYQDMRANMANLRSYLNQYATALKAFPVPKVYTIRDKYKQMFSNYYGDVDAETAQMYMYEPNGFWSYDEANGKCVFNARALAVTYNVLTTIGDTLLSALQDSQTAVLLCGNTIKAYSPDSLAYVEEVQDNEIVMPYYDLRVLMTIQNTIMTGTPQTASLEITQDPTNLNLLFDPVFDRVPYDNAFPVAYQLNIPKDNVTPEDVLAITADMSFMYQSGGTAIQPECKIYSCGSEVITSATIAWLDTNNNTILRMVISSTYVINRGSVTSVAAFESLTKRIFMPAKFDWHPRTWIISYNSGSSTPTATLHEISDMDINKYTVIREEQLSQIHKVRLLNYYASPTPQFK